MASLTSESTLSPLLSTRQAVVTWSFVVFHSHPVSTEFSVSFFIVYIMSGIEKGGAEEGGDLFIVLGGCQFYIFDL